MRQLTGSALAAAIGAALAPAISEAVRDYALRLVAAVGEGSDLPSPPLWGRAGEGGEPPASSVELRSSPAAPLPDPPPQRGRGAEGSRRVTAKRGDTSIRLTLSAPGLFAREFGALGVPAEPLLGPAIDALRRRRA